ncbi:MAG: helicase C-terminal domain-containing protein [Syntrophomonadaceae bacterium]|nr:helicase C-terminal domain-containing protein [Syntrophomonadaceae bacterium]
MYKLIANKPKGTRGMDEFCSEEVLKYFAPDGQMARIIPGYKYRQEQVHLAAGIATAFQNREFLVSEVGTGVGKTYAYLIPAVLWTRFEKEKIVISTKTKALQQQIIENDLPDIKNVLGFDFKFAEAKGRENYLCWNKYINILGGKKRLDAEEQEFMETILTWAERTRTGDKKELEISSKVMQKWGIVAADRKSCRKEMCKYHDKCFRLKMLKNLQKADVIVVNHALLLSDILVDNSILPEYHYLIVDEAHTFDRESFDKLSTCFAYKDMMEVLLFLHRKGKTYQRGYLQYLRSTYKSLSILLEETGTLVDREMQLLDELYSLLSNYSGHDREYNFAVIIDSRSLETPWWEKIVDVYLDWQENTNLLINKLTAIFKETGEEDEESELSIVIMSLQTLSDAAFQILEEDINNAGKIAWIEYEKNRAVAVSSSSIHAGEMLSSSLYQKLDSMVMVSATLAIEEKFEHFIEKCGLAPLANDGRLNTLLEKSPFAYEKQAILYTVEDMPDPSSPLFTEQVAGLLPGIFSSAGSHSMVLFTSKKQLREVSKYIRPWCEKNGIKLLVQYEDGEFGFLLDEYAGSNKAVLMGVETFWEGIDLKGELLECVVIVKLPFRSPSDPFCCAGDKYYKMLKKNSFRHFMLPDAAVRFKQGIGRLIRSEEDRGAVIVLDTRLEKKVYGSVFKNSIPITNITCLKKGELSRELQKYFASCP